MNGNTAELEPFEKRIKRIFALIGLFTAFVILYLYLLANVYLEFVPGAFLSFEGYTLISTAIALLYFIYLVVFIIKGIKKNDSMNLKSLILRVIQTALLSLLVYLVYQMVLPRVIFCASFAALSILSAVILSIIADKEEKKNIIFFMIIITLLFGAFISAKVFLTNILYPGQDFEQRLVLIQSKEPTKNISKSVKYITVPELKPENEDPQTIGYFTDDSVFSNTTDRNTFISELRDSIKNDKEINEKQKLAFDEAADFLEKQFSSYDDDFFKDHCLLLKTGYFWDPIVDSSIRNIVREWARNRLYIYYDTTYDPQARDYIEGYCFYLISLPKDKRAILDTSDERFIPIN